MAPVLTPTSTLSPEELIALFPKLERFRLNRAIGGVRGKLIIEEKKTSIIIDGKKYRAKLNPKFKEYLRLNTTHNLEEEQLFRVYIKDGKYPGGYIITILGIDNDLSVDLINVFALRGVVLSPTPKKKTRKIKIHRNVNVKHEPHFYISFNPTQEYPAEVDASFSEIFCKLGASGLEYISSKVFYSIKRSS